MNDWGYDKTFFRICSLFLTLAKPYFAWQKYIFCSNAFILFWPNILSPFSRNFNYLIMKYQSYLKSRKINAFEQKICSSHIYNNYYIYDQYGAEVVDDPEAKVTNPNKSNVLDCLIDFRKIVKLWISLLTLKCTLHDVSYMTAKILILN